MTSIPWRRNGRRPLGLIVIAMALTSVAGGCGDLFESRTLLTSYRVLGMRADPVEPGIDDEIRLQLFDFDPSLASDDPETLTYEWKICLYSFGSVTLYECVDPGLELPVESGGWAAVIDLNRLDSSGLSLREVMRALMIGMWKARDLEKGVDVDDDDWLEDRKTEFSNLLSDEGIPLWIKVDSGRGQPGTEGSLDRVQSVKMLVVYDEPSDNRNPEIVDLVVAGVPSPGGGETEGSGNGISVAVQPGESVSIEVRLQPGAAQQFTDYEPAEEAEDPPIEVEKIEELTHAWFSTGGEIEPIWSTGEDTEATFKAPEEAGPVQVMVTVRDNRGGITMAKRTLIVSEAR